MSVSTERRSGTTEAAGTDKEVLAKKPIRPLGQVHAHGPVRYVIYQFPDGGMYSVTIGISNELASF